MIVLGINGIDGLFHDASASIIVDGRIVASVEEERFNRRKHSNGLPVLALEYCLKKAGVKPGQIDHVGYYLDPDVLEKTLVEDILRDYACPPRKLHYYRDAIAKMRVVRATLGERFPMGPGCRFHYMNHHLAHAASAFFISGFDEAAVLTIDGSGDRETSTLYLGRGKTLSRVHDFLVFPQSLGFIYTVFAHHLGFDWISGPGKLMGLAGFGQPDPARFHDIIRLGDDPQKPVDIDLSFFDYHVGGSGMTARGLERFGPRRAPEEPFTQTHYDLAASAQDALERAILHIVGMIPRHLPGIKNLCFAGGVALNVCTNRRIIDTGLFSKLFVPPAASDAGTSLGCALALSAEHGGRGQHDYQVYLGPDMGKDFDVEADLRLFDGKIRWEKLAEEPLCRQAAEHIAQNHIIGWAMGRMETGPRALGNRSILTNPVNPRAKDDLNTRVKKREPFRPYAPSVLKEFCGEYFDLADSPHMLLEARVLPAKRGIIPGVVHVDGTSRPQTVTKESNARYRRLLEAVHAATGVPMVVNTSFNLHGEPIVNTPAQAVRDLLETDMDALFVDDYYIRKA